MKKGFMQCPRCKCTDVPIDVELCPFCGYEFVKQQPEGTEEPKPSNYKAYKKKGLKKQIVAENAPQEQGGKTAVGWLAAALVVAVLLMTSYCMNRMMIQNPRAEYLTWSYILSGAMTGFLHVCCYANEKGSRWAGFLGIISGAIGLVLLMAYNDSGQFIGLAVSKDTLRGNIIRLVIYGVCWLTAAKLAHDKKNAFVFSLIAAEFILFPYLVNWLLYRTKPQIIGWPFAIFCAAMLITDFLLYRIKAWLALKPRKLFWVFYVIVMIVALVSLYDSRRLLFL